MKCYKNNKSKNDISRAKSIEAIIPKKEEEARTEQTNNTTRLRFKVKYPIDTHVGYRLREIRQARGITQAELGRKVGITFQQIQKYEKGQNRIAAGRLYELSRLFNVPIGSFYEGYGAKACSNNDRDNNKIQSRRLQRDRERISHIFSSIEDKSVRKSIIDLAESFIDKLEEIC